MTIIVRAPFILTHTNANPTKLSRFIHTTTLLREVASDEVRVRFAPSPTGHLHLGGLRTAFYNYVFARQNKGTFILRIENTDQARIVPGSAQEIEHTLDWAGLSPDESPQRGGPYGPYEQSRRLELYKQWAEHLLNEGKAYRCFCSPTRLDLLRKFQARNREKIRYDGKCKTLTQSEIEEKLAENDNRHVIRFSLLDGQYCFNDLIFGEITANLVDALESDPIIIKSDGYPTYHFASIVDDHHMKISHVLRGSEWISSTTKHVQLYEALNWQAPKFAHFPLITLRDGTKMSKRNDHSHVTSWIQAGYQPETLLNFLTSSGGGVPKVKQDSMEFWSLGELVKGFDFKQVTCHPGSLDLNRLHVYSAQELQRTWARNPGKVMEQFKKLLQANKIETDMDDETAQRVIDKLIGRLTLLNDLLLHDYVFIWRQPQLSWNIKDYVELGWNLRDLIVKLANLVDKIDLEDKEKFTEALKKISTDEKLDYSRFMRFVRRLLTNSEKGLPVYEICCCLGKSRLKQYLNNGLEYVDKGA
uniref:Nondiscriminating glutamyl-tRNA synthetase EARS2, mitochondrial n=1 Tax=Aceria tosichella TaxID=561515 RepID=A0A6G1SP42_9ACAR